MTPSTDSPYDALERIFHEPNRLAIMSAVCGSREGLTFNELRDICSLTDGNLNRHLRVLEEAGAVRIEKTFVGVKPRTTVHLSPTGRQRFQDYLSALGDVLKKARRSLPTEEVKDVVRPSARHVQA